MHTSSITQRRSLQRHDRLAGKHVVSQACVSPVALVGMVAAISPRHSLASGAPFVCMSDVCKGVDLAGGLVDDSGLVAFEWDRVIAVASIINCVYEKFGRQRPDSSR